jgi:pseudaminic acid synthase
MGDMDRARDMISASKENGADFVKFQTWSVSRLKRGPWDDDGRLEIYKEAELTREKHIELLEFSNKIGIPFFTSVFSIPDAELLHSLEVDTVKIASAESRNKELLKFCDGVFKTIYTYHGDGYLDCEEESRKFMTERFNG